MKHNYMAQKKKVRRHASFYPLPDLPETDLNERREEIYIEQAVYLEKRRERRHLLHMLQEQQKREKALKQEQGESESESGSLSMEQLRQTLPLEEKTESDLEMESLLESDAQERPYDIGLHCQVSHSWAYLCYVDSHQL